MAAAMAITFSEDFTDLVQTVFAVWSLRVGSAAYKPDSGLDCSPIVQGSVKGIRNGAILLAPPLPTGLCNAKYAVECWNCRLVFLPSWMVLVQLSSLCYEQVPVRQYLTLTWCYWFIQFNRILAKINIYVKFIIRQDEDVPAYVLRRLFSGWMECWNYYNQAREVAVYVAMHLGRNWKSQDPMSEKRWRKLENKTIVKG